MNGGLATLVGAGIEWQAVPSFPVDHALALGLRIVGLPDDQDHSLNVTILGPTMEPATDPLDTTFRLGTGPGHVEGWEAAAVVPLVIRFRVETAGAYTVVATVDGAAKQVTVRFTDSPPA
ncbi:MAG: DUF6941 family protein [Acidimicrobiales bacterium]